MSEPLYAGIMSEPLYTRGDDDTWRPFVRCRNLAGSPAHDLRTFGPRPPDATPHTCAACGKPFLTGEWTTLLALGPGDDAEARAKAADGRYYSAVAVEIHLACCNGSERPPQMLGETI